VRRNCEGGRVKRRGAKISDHVLRVPSEFGVRLGIVGVGEERGGRLGVGQVEYSRKEERGWYSYWSSETNGRVC